MEHQVLGGRYELLEVVGEGGMGTVYKAHCNLLDRIVAVKILKPEFKRNKSFIEKFKTEALAAARINHPNIVNIFDVGIEEDVQYIVMEYVEGETLKDFIERSGVLPIDRAIHIGIMICDAVQHAHEKGIIHRDIKPQNILITRQGLAKVADFGVARANTEATITFGQNVVGSVHYISPEQARGSAVDCTTDIYSMGCVLYEMTTGQVPFEAESPVTVALKHIHDEPLDPTELNSKIPVGLEGIIMRAMAKSPMQRFPSAQAMQNSLLSLASDKNYVISTVSDAKSGQTIIMTTPPVQPGRKKKRKIKPLGWTFIGIAALAFTIGVFTTLGGMVFGEEITVPQITSKTIKEADEILRAENFTMNVITSQHNDEIAKDLIISQDPVAGSKVKANREIKVILSLGPNTVTVPDVRGDKLSTATLKIQNSGLEVGSTQNVYDSKYAEGEIISQSPQGGNNAKLGTKVDLMISKGQEPARVKMPTLTNATLDTAKERLNSAGLELGSVQEVESTTYSQDYVTSQSVAPDTLVEQGTKINITVSKGPGPASATITTVKYKDIQFTLPKEKTTYNVTVKIKDAKGTRTVHEDSYSAGETVVLNASYYEPATCEIYLDGNLYRTEKL